MKIDKLQLGTGADIPLPAAGVVIHVPRMKEIAMIGENTFHIGLQLLNVNKKKLINNSMDKTLQETLTNFDIIMQMMTDSRSELQENKNAVQLTLDLLFPNCEHIFSPVGLFFKYTDSQKFLKKDDYEDFQKMLITIFQLDKQAEDSPDYNPVNAAAAAIAKKLEEGRKKVSSIKNNDDVDISVFDHYISILSIGQRIDRNVYNNYTPYQLYSEFDRYIKKYSWDMVTKARLAGATGIQDVENWMQ